MIDRLNTALEGRYHIERELGEGGMATVFLAEDIKHKRLQHPRILPLYDSGEADGFLFYAMPYVEGESLREVIDRKKQLPVDRAVRIATQIAEADGPASDIYSLGCVLYERDVAPVGRLRALDDRRQR